MDGSISLPSISAGDIEAALDIIDTEAFVKFERGS
jgi:hypothetical protein